MGGFFGLLSGTDNIVVFEKWYKIAWILLILLIGRGMKREIDIRPSPTFERTAPHLHGVHAVDRWVNCFLGELALQYRLPRFRSSWYCKRDTFSWHLDSSIPAWIATPLRGEKWERCSGTGNAGYMRARGDNARALGSYVSISCNLLPLLRHGL